MAQREVRLQLGLLLGVEVRVRDDLDARGGEGGPQVVRPDLIELPAHDEAAALGLLELVGHGHAVHGVLVAVGLGEAAQPADALGVELVEVAAGDGEELEAFEQRVAAVARLGEDAVVEVEPAQLAVGVPLRCVEVEGAGRGVTGRAVVGGRDRGLRGHAFLGLPGRVVSARPRRVAVPSIAERTCGVCGTGPARGRVEGRAAARLPTPSRRLGGTLYADAGPV